MKFVWLLLLLPAHPSEKVSVFPGSFPTKEACMTMGTVLITQRAFRCAASEQPTGFAELAIDPKSLQVAALGD